MDSIEAVRAMVARSGKSGRGIGLAMGKHPNWISSTLGKGTDVKAGTLALIADICGYDLQLIKRDGSEVITIDAPVSE